MYHEYADWFPLLTHPAEYDVSAAQFSQGFEGAARRRVRHVLVLGSGAGNTAGHLKQRFNLTLTDISEEMLAVSRRAHAECEHVVGDMRTVRLRKKFDAVLVEDAIMYMVTEDDLAQVFATAFAHLRAGGGAAFAPDEVTETFRPGTEAGGHDDRGRSMRYLQWTLPPRRGSTTQTVAYTYMFREGRKPMRFDYEIHECGLFPRATWERLIVEAGFELDEYWETPEGGVVFSAHKPGAGARGPAGGKTVLRVCSRCGTMTETKDGTVPLGWSVDFAGGRVDYLCPSCARASIRAIEGRLPEEYWE